MQNPESFEVHPIEAGERNWRALAGSVVAHLVLILLILLRPFREPEAGPVEQSESATPVALAPQIPFRQQDQPRPRTQPVVPEKPVPLGPDSDRPDEPPREAGPETPPPEQPDPTREPPVQPSQAQPDERASPAPRTNRIPTPEDLVANGTVLGPPTSPFGRSTTQRIGAPTGTATSGASALGAMGRTGFSTRDTRSWRESFPEAAGQCVEIPDLGTNPDGTPVLASVSGIVLDDRGRPLAGAHLQIVGQAFATFTDGNGGYRLEFDPKLLERCRVQYVRVTAEGYRTQDLHLAVGRNARSDDVLMRRR